MREGIEQIILQQLNDAGTASASELHAGLEAEPEFDGVSLPVFRAHVSFMKTKSGSVESFGQGTKAKYALTAVGRVILGLEPPAPEFKIPVASESTGEWVPVEPPVDSIIAEYPNDLLEDATGFPGDILSDTETAPERVIGERIQMVDDLL